ncbi:carboxy terminal-processing peptidase [Algivirga pacifica]|uniref:Carboxy terminal-processing peptidase n=2 Tax=Algivirga pacifica TaxID=1162670 RepID=A0ABP9D407_9BACT
MNADKQSVIKELLYITLRQAHFNNINVDDKFSEQAFDAYIERMDPNKRYFLKEDIELLSQYKRSIDDDLKGARSPLFEESQRILKQRHEEAEQYMEEVVKESMNFSKEEQVELDADKIDFAASKKELKDRWRQQVKYATLVRVNDKMTGQEKKKEDAKKNKEEFTPKTFEEIEVEAREKVEESYSNMFSVFEKMDDVDRFSTYVNAIVSIYGPHTEFFPPESKEKFDEEMAGKFEGIGARLQQSGDEIKVVQIIPGSASWKQGELKEGDVILKVAQGTDEPVSVESMSLKNAVKLIKGPKGTEVRLSVRKPDGRLEVVPIIRDVVIIKESYSKSAVIKDQATGKKWGVINLPSFYADFNDRKGRSSGEDVEQEILKLKGQNVDGIILDLRNNGGGSLGDAVKMSGLFIDKGPIVQVRDRMNSSRVHEDFAKGAVYDGPLVVMVNKFSASASEILAAALQDYDRAVIVGSNTFGKGTVQRFIDLDRLVNSRKQEFKPLGAIKLTVQKFYRVDGGATQVNGVKPDILLPDTYAYLDVGEKDLPNVMPWDRIEQANYMEWNRNVDLKKLRSSSEQRVKSNQVFQMIEQNALRMKENSDMTLQSLNYDKFASRQQMLKEESDKFSKLEKEHEGLDIAVMPSHVATDEPDSVIVRTANTWKEQLVKDVYIKEATDVLNDWVESSITKK